MEVVSDGGDDIDFGNGLVARFILAGMGAAWTVV